MKRFIRRFSDLQKSKNRETESTQHSNQFYELYVNITTSDFRKYIGYPLSYQYEFVRNFIGKYNEIAEKFIENHIKFDFRFSDVGRYNKDKFGKTVHSTAAIHLRQDPSENVNTISAALLLVAKIAEESWLDYTYEKWNCGGYVRHVNKNCLREITETTYVVTKTMYKDCYRGSISITSIAAIDYSTKQKSVIYEQDDNQVMRVMYMSLYDTKQLFNLTAYDEKGKCTFSALDSYYVPIAANAVVDKSIKNTTNMKGVTKMSTTIYARTLCNKTEEENYRVENLLLNGLTSVTTHILHEENNGSFNYKLFEIVCDTDESVERIKEFARQGMFIIVEKKGGDPAARYIPRDFN